ncbi:O-antigen ligase family protein [Luteolibacter yonseiensis]|uniref:O-antigen ligase family protein n=1 Tax=Luteolibacter yonseiensis TaxID=1144680 RepID=A0A934VA16_9BACT|nr:O-antigen ligase family protein [Luteolibacter yonseiensis]MBK1814386.1 O-antigen ligase family protein [Luteolibacter yonseiensis]
MDSQKIKTILLLTIAAIGALYLGIAAATAQFETVLWIVGVIGLSVCVALGRRIWLIIPFASSLGLVVPLPGNFTTEMMAQIVTLGFCSLLFLMRKLPMRPRITILEVWCAAFTLCVVQTYMRNPVGLNLLGGDSVGGKPYVFFAITAAAAYLLSVILVAPNDLRWCVRLSVISGVMNFGLGLISKLVPAIGYYFGATFSSDVENGESVAPGEATRVSFVRQISLTLANWISSRISPLKASFHPLWMPLVLASLAAAAFSGYRSQLIHACLYFLVGIFYRGGMRAIFASFFLGAAGLFMLALVNSIAPLPANVQRALTFLPGTWDQRFQRDAEGSTDWRVEMWKEALFTEKWIKNKWLGDGLGFTKKEFEAMKKFEDDRGGVAISGLSNVQESMMINGGYHSGPVQTIRTVGYVGLAVLVSGFILVAVHAHRQIQRTRGTEWFPVALFICSPFIVSPIFWLAIIGTFEGGARVLLMGTAMVGMLHKNLPLPAYKPARSYSPLPRPHPHAGSPSVPS